MEYAQGDFYHSCKFGGVKVCLILTNKGCFVLVGVSLRAETSLPFPGRFNLPEEIPPSPGHPSGESLQESMNRLERGLNSGTLLLQFDVRISRHVRMPWACLPEACVQIG